ncbi:hypothetical protein EJB05_25934, partial [Eragrostis curvula]
MFDASVTVRLRDGNKALFWKDKWINGHSVEDFAPSIVRTISDQVRNTRTVQEALSEEYMM